MKHNLKIMDTDQKMPQLIATILLTIFGVAVLVPTLWANENIVEPLAKSDFGKTMLLRCIRGKSSQVSCETYRLDLPSHNLSIARFQLIDVTLHEYSAPESSSSYSLNLTTSAANIDVTHGDFEKDESNYRKLKELLTQTRETSVSLKYQSSFIRVIIIWLLNCLMFLGFSFGSMGFILGVINSIFLALKVLIQFIKFIGISSFMILGYCTGFVLKFLNSIPTTLKLLMKCMKSIRNH
jgi:hypothetical protein